MKLIDISRISVLNIHYNNYTLDYFLDCQARLGVKNVELLGAHQGLWMDEYGYQAVSYTHLSSTVEPESNIILSPS